VQDFSTSTHVSKSPEFSGVEGFLNPDSIIGYLKIEKGMSVVDFGSGSGFFTILIAKQVGEGGKVYALDILESALDSVKARARSENVNNIKTIRTNLEVVGASGLYDVSQDAILVANVLFQSDKKEEIFQEARRILKPNGSLIVIDWIKGVEGFGPPDNSRVSEDYLKTMASRVGFSFDNRIDAGRYHFGLIFSKNT
jgi:ubiquinone/menaquinone biosynthesis C-methylase UbiE